MKLRIIAILTLVFLPLGVFADITFSPSSGAITDLVSIQLNGSCTDGTHAEIINPDDTTLVGFRCSTGEPFQWYWANGHSFHLTDFGATQNGTYHIWQGFDNCYNDNYDGNPSPTQHTVSGGLCAGSGGTLQSGTFVASTPVSISSTSTIFMDTVQPDFDNMTGYKFNALMYIPVQMVMSGIGLFLLFLNLSWPYLVGFIAIVGTIYCLYQIGRRHI